VSEQFKTYLSFPKLLEGNSPDLDWEGTLTDLPTYHFGVKSDSSVSEVVRQFQRHALLPGVLIWEDIESEEPQLVGLLSRRQLLEFFIRPQGGEMLASQSLGVCYSYGGFPMLVLPETMTILEAARYARRRSPELIAEPIVVAHPGNPAIPYSILNIDDLNIAHWQIRGIETQVRYERSQIQMIQSEKMSNLGRLVDGVAHEILDPVGFIWGNLTHLNEYAQGLMELLSAYEQHFPQVPPEIEAKQEEIELDFVRSDLPRVVASINGGADRLNRLATSLQNFCHIDNVHPKPADLQGSLDSIVLLIQSKIKGEIEIIRHYGQVPPVSCYIGQLNQVFMNILTNAVNALIDRAVRQDWVDEFGPALRIQRSDRPRIEITIKVSAMKDDPENPPRGQFNQESWVLIKISDNGPGMSLSQSKKILESFSAHRRADKETSLGLSYQIVTAKHGGKLNLRSQLGVGTEFEIWLPLT